MVPVYPAFAKSMATCRPMPREAPTMRATSFWEVDMLFLMCMASALR